MLIIIYGIGVDGLYLPWVLHGRVLIILHGYTLIRIYIFIMGVYYNACVQYYNLNGYTLAVICTPIHVLVVLESPGRVHLPCPQGPGPKCGTSRFIGTAPGPPAPQGASRSRWRIRPHSPPSLGPHSIVATQLYC